MEVNYMQKRLNKRFESFALSQSGCDGGNLKSDIWVCGLEWGVDVKSLNDLNKIMEGPFNTASWDGEIQQRLKYPYNNKIAWLFSYLFKWEENHKKAAENHRMMCFDGTGYKMNAFPIPFKNRSSVSWSKDMADLIGLHSFEVYLEWCIENRGKYFQELVKENSPKMIVCTGKNTTMAFLRFFGCDMTSVDSGENFTVAKCNESKTLVFVTPFFGGASGINSFEKMKALADEIKKYAESCASISFSRSSK